MTSAPPKKRPWFQLHLSTCVVLMVVAGWIVMINVLQYSEVVIFPDSTKCRNWGWPQPFYYVITDWDGNPKEIEPSSEWWNHYNPHSPLIPANLAFDLLITSAILGGIAYACERIIRRRERTRAAQEPAP